MDDFKSHVVLSEERSGIHSVLKCSNNYPLPVTVELTVSGENVDVLENINGAPRKLKSLHILPAYSTDNILAAVKPKIGTICNFRFDYRGALGASVSVHDDTVRYNWPFEASAPRECLQSFGGQFSHNTKETFHSVDFAMPVGTPVVAARRGTVLAIKVDEGSGGNNPSFKLRSNYVHVCHSDGSVASYSHLAYGGAVVALGQVVKEGDIIGHSGDSGFINKPCVEFSLFLPKGNPGAWKTIPFVFEDGSPNGCVPTESCIYPGGSAAAAAAPAATMGMTPPVKGPAKGVKKFVKKIPQQQPDSAVPAKPVTNSSPVPPPVDRSNKFGSGPMPSVATPPPEPPRTHQQQQSPPPPQKEWTGKYASPALLPVKPKPPTVDRSAKPVAPPPSNSPYGAAPPMSNYNNGGYAEPYYPPQQPNYNGGGYAEPYYPPQQQQPNYNGGGYAEPYYPPPQPNAPPPSNYYAPEPAPPGVSSSMVPGTRSAPPSKALHPELYSDKKPVERNADGSAVQDCMKPGYQRETDTVEEIKRAVDIRRHNPIKKTSKRLSLATPTTSDLRTSLRGFGNF